MRGLWRRAAAVAAVTLVLCGCGGPPELIERSDVPGATSDQQGEMKAVVQVPWCTLLPEAVFTVGPKAAGSYFGNGRSWSMGAAVLYETVEWEPLEGRLDAMDEEAAKCQVTAATETRFTIERLENLPQGWRGWELEDEDIGNASFAARFLQDGRVLTAGVRVDSGWQPPMELNRLLELAEQGAARYPSTFEEAIQE